MDTGRITATRGLLLVSCLLSGVFGFGCSLVNSFDELTQQNDAGADAGVDAGPRGVIVVGGSIASSDGGPDTFVLTALDPLTGNELPSARERMKVAAVQYDNARDLWYVFESGGQGVFALPGDPYYIHVRRIDPVAGAWSELGRAAIPPGLSFATTAVIGQRVSYVAYASGAQVDDDAGSSGELELITIDTTDPTALAISSVVSLSDAPVALTGTPSSVNPAGGFVTLGSTDRTPTSAVAQLTPILVPASDPPSVEPSIIGTAPAGGLVGFGAASIGGTTDAIVITHPLGAPTTPATLAIYDPTVNDPSRALVAAGQFAFADDAVKPPAFSACSQVAFVVGTNVDLNLYAVSLAGAALPDADGGLPTLNHAAIPTGHSGQGVYFEPYTNTVLVPFSQGDNYALTAFSFTGTPEAPQLAVRTSPSWTPPVHLRPNFVATRGPRPPTCPATH